MFATREETWPKKARCSLAVLALALGLAGCGGSDGTGGTTTTSGGSSPSPHGTLLSATPLENWSGAQIQASYEQNLIEELGNQVGMVRETSDYLQWSAAMSNHTSESSADYQVTYVSRDANQAPINLTGAIFLPPRGSAPKSVPIVLYPHGTELKRDAVPSNGGKGGPEAVVGMAAALAFDLVVAMPDLPGMGGADPKAYHPYCHANSLAYSVADMLKATVEHLAKRSSDFVWNGDVYVVGYSEGGYAAMATVRELQNHPSDYPSFTLRGSACMAAPCDLSGDMRAVMLNPSKEFPAAFFLPYVIYGYNAVYSNSSFAPSSAINATLLESRIDGNITQWMDGNLAGKQADALIENRMQIASGHHPIPLNMLNPTWVTSQLADPAFANSTVGNALRDNDLDRGWAPNEGTKMLIMHAYDDDCVPYANSLHAYQAFQAAGATTRVRFVPIGQPGDGTTHVEAAMMAFPAAYCWIYNNMPMK